MTVPYDIIADVIRVLTHISQGNVPTEACDECGLSYQTFCTYTAKYPQLRSMREEAEDRCYDVLADRLLTIQEHITDPKMATVVSSNTKWLLERRRSKQYGAKSTLEVNLTADREVLDALQSAKARAEGRTTVQAVSTADVLDLTVLDGVARVVTAVVPVTPTVPAFDEERHRRELAEIS